MAMNKCCNTICNRLWINLFWNVCKVMGQDKTLTISLVNYELVYISESRDALKILNFRKFIISNL